MEGGGGGAPEPYCGDGVKAAFGMDVAREDDAERASAPVVTGLFGVIKKNYHRLFFHYL